MFKVPWRGPVLEVSPRPGETIVGNHIVFRVTGGDERKFGDDIKNATSEHSRQKRDVPVIYQR